MGGGFDRRSCEAITCLLLVDLGVAFRVGSTAAPVDAADPVPEDVRLPNCDCFGIDALCLALAPAWIEA